ncbi:MAG: shikimate kinase [Deltaproteobacteria bacterium]|nr:shikimate kinase [Deltaproteobacteria bacterium]
MRQALILIGPPGCGKSTFGQWLAEKNHIPFFDLDRMIEEKYHVSIPELFERKNESYFRVLEFQCLNEFQKRVLPSKYILATGGGTILSLQNRQILKKLGKVIYLKTSLDTILQRALEEERPLFKNKTEDSIRIILKEREKYYKESDITLDTEGKSVTQICKELMEEGEG